MDTSGPCYMGLTTGQMPFLRVREGGRVSARSLSQSLCNLDVLELKLKTQLLTVHGKSNRLSLSRLDYEKPLTSICSLSHPLHHCLTQSLRGEIAPVEWAGIDGEELVSPASGPLTLASSPGVSWEQPVSQDSPGTRGAWLPPWLRLCESHRHRVKSHSGFWLGNHEL